MLKKPHVSNGKAKWAFLLRSPAQHQPPRPTLSPTSPRNLGRSRDPGPKRPTGKTAPLLWMDKIRSHQIKTMVETVVCWYLQGNHYPMALIWWCDMDFVQIHSRSSLPGEKCARPRVFLLLPAVFGAFLGRRSAFRLGLGIELSGLEPTPQPAPVRPVAVTSDRVLFMVRFGESRAWPCSPASASNLRIVRSRSAEESLGTAIEKARGCAGHRWFGGLVGIAGNRWRLATPRVPSTKAKASNEPKLCQAGGVRTPFRGKKKEEEKTLPGFSRTTGSGDGKDPAVGTITT